MYILVGFYTAIFSGPNTCRALARISICTTLRSTPPSEEAAGAGAGASEITTWVKAHVGIPRLNSTLGRWDRRS